MKPQRFNRPTAEARVVDCRVAELAEEYERLTVAHQRADMASVNAYGTDSDEHDRQSGLLRQIDECIEAVENMASWRIATSWRGVLFQICLAHQALASVHDSIATTQNHVDDDYHRGRRLLYAIRTATKALTGCVGSEVVESWGMSPTADPVTPAAIAIAPAARKAGAS